jgi:Tfp pilus assembly protein PilF
LLLACALGPLNSANAQKNNIADPIQQAKKYLTEKNYQKAEFLLANHYRKHLNDLETSWLYAQVAHWNKHERLSASLFVHAMELAPEDYSLKLDYARMLYESGRLTHALEIINTIKSKGNTPVEALLLEANMLFWQGRIEEAKSVINAINKWYPSTSLTNELEKSIAALCATRVKSNVDYQRDNQPMGLFAEQISYEKFSSRLLNPMVQLNNFNFSTGNNMVELNIQNRLLFARYGLSGGLSAGMYKHFSDRLNWTGSIDLQYKIDKSNRFSFALNRKPYLGTLKSNAFALLQNNASAEFDSEVFRKFMVHLGCNHQFFDDRNSVNAAGAWVLSKAKSNKKCTFQYGYGFSYSNARKNVFESRLPVSQLLSQYVDGMSIAGIFNPYFTPRQQNVHTALLVFHYRPNAKLDLGLKANYGFYAFCSNPYLFLEKNNAGETIVGKDYTKVHFNPYEVQADANYHFSSHFDAGLRYQHQETFFFSRNLMSLSLRYTN